MANFYLKDNTVVYTEVWTDFCINRGKNFDEYIPSFPHWLNIYSQYEWVEEAIQVIQNLCHPYLCRRIGAICKKLDIEIIETAFIYDENICPNDIGGWRVITKNEFLQISDFTKFEDTYAFYGLSKVVIEMVDKNILSRLNKYKYLI
jgi:hypothetical protein